MTKPIRDVLKTVQEKRAAGYKSRHVPKGTPHVKGEKDDP